VPRRPHAGVLAAVLLVAGLVGAVAPGTPADPAATSAADPAASLAGAREETVSSIFRYDPAAATAAREDFDRACAEARDRFRRSAAARFGAPTLPATQTATPEFAEFHRRWLAAWPGFPPHLELARAWAQGEAGEAALQPLRDRLTDVLSNRWIREAVLPPDAQLGPGEIRLVPVAPPGEILTATVVAARAQPGRRSQLLAPAQARQEVREGFPHEDGPAAQFVASLVRPNVFFEAELTAEARRLNRAHPPAADSPRPATTADPAPLAAPAAPPPASEPSAAGPEWLLLGLIPLLWCAGALALAAWLSRARATAPESGAAPPSAGSPRQRLAPLGPKLSAPLEAADAQIRALEVELPEADNIARAELRRRLLLARDERDRERIRLGLQSG
jgi:hypothetical protein